MRLPAVPIAAAFACGIALGLLPAVARNAASLLLLSSSFVTIAVLVLQTAPGEIATSAKNNDSLVLRLRYGRLNILLPGDAEKQVEREILSENSAEELHSDVLKIGHHGSKNSTTPEFLAAVQPLVGIISAGEDNPYGHPRPELLERLENAGVRVLTTDRDGAVHVLTDGARLEITCFVACPGVANAAASALAKAPDHQQDY